MYHVLDVSTQLTVLLPKPITIVAQNFLPCEVLFSNGVDCLAINPRWTEEFFRFPLRNKGVNIG